MKKILPAVDGSDHAQTSLSIASAIAKEHQSEILVVHVVTNDKPSPSTMNAIEVEFADEFMKRVSGKIDKNELSVEAQYASTVLSNQTVVSQIANSIMGKQILEHACNDLHQKGITSPKAILVDGDPAD